MVAPNAELQLVSKTQVLRIVPLTMMEARSLGRLKVRLRMNLSQKSYILGLFLKKDDEKLALEKSSNFEVGTARKLKNASWRDGG